MNDKWINIPNFFLIGLMAYLFIYLFDRLLVKLGPHAAKFTIAQ